MEIIRDPARPKHADIIGEIAVGAQYPGAFAAARGGFNVNDLAGGMHTGVGTPGAMASHGDIRDTGKGLFHAGLHGACVVLNLPPVESSAVVFQSKRDAHGASQTGGGRVSLPG
jgi:hypothetical protein